MDDGEWYLHLYAPEQPDFNWRNPEVRREFEDILRFWLDRGVDGFRIDVAAGLFKDASFRDLGGRGRRVADAPIYSRPEVHDVYRSGARSSTSTTASAWPSARCGRTAPKTSRSTSAQTNCTRSSSSTCNWPHGRPARSVTW